MAHDDDLAGRTPKVVATDTGVPTAGAHHTRLGAHLHDPDVARLLARTPSRLANQLSTVLDPPLVAAFTLLVAALRGSSSVLHGVGWWLVSVMFVAGIPLGFLAWFVRKGWVADRHVVVRRERHLLLLIAAASSMLGVVVLGTAHAPRPLWACQGSMLLGVAAVAVANTVVKASGHTGTMTGAASLLALIWTPWTLVASVPMTLAVAWARLRAGRHSGVQVLVGGLVGLVASLAYLWLR